MLLKAKCAQQTVLKEIQKDQANDASRIKKLKDQKKKIQIGVSNLSTITPVGLKRLHKPSKSTLEPYQNPHYNSPSNPLGQNQNMQINSSFSFTNILQQNMKNKHSQQSIHNFQHQRLSNYQIIDSRLSAHGLSRQHNARNSQKNKSIKNDLTNIEYSMKLKEVSCSKSHLNKSPSKIVNTNRIHNTPKLKQQHKIEKEQRTFRDLLDKQQNSSIKLQCSEKLFKFIENDAAVRQIYPKSIHLSHSSDKSNLLSTGVISMSQKYENNKFSMEIIKNSKEDICDNQYGRENQQTKQFFPEESQEQSSQTTFSDKIQKIKSKLISSKMENNFCTQNNLQKNIKKLLFYDQKNSNDNNQSKYIEFIAKLMSIKTNLMENLKYIISNVEKLSNQFISQIEESISRIKEIQNGSVDWYQIQRELSLNDNIFLSQCQSDTLLMRIQALEKQINREKQNDYCSKMFFNDQLSKIEEKTSSLISKKSQSSLFHCKRSQMIRQSLADIESQLKKIWSNFQETLPLIKPLQ